MELPFRDGSEPLAARMRPRTLDEFVGQEHILAPGRLLRRAIELDRLGSVILAGPPGTGKTTLARIVATQTQAQFITVNAVLSGVKEIREAIAAAQRHMESVNRRTILFVDEVHRWSRSQQDALLPWVEQGLFTLVGATTENPYFEVNRALLSRSRVFMLRPLDRAALEAVIDRTLSDRVHGYGSRSVEIDRDARDHLIRVAAGDARSLLNALELAVEGAGDAPPETVGATPIHVTLSVAEESIQRAAVLYDRDGDYHYDAISAFIKSVRGSDPDASLYWLARMVAAGEDARFLFRRLLILASEDVGMADPDAIATVEACAAAFDRVGLPEGRYHLAHATLRLALAPKSNSTLGFFAALESVEASGAAEVPRHLKDASRDGDDLGHGAGYAYPHAYRDHWVAQRYLPAELAERTFYEPGSLGWEGERVSRLAERRLQQAALQDDDGHDPWSAAGRLVGASGWVRRAERASDASYEPLLDAVAEAAAVGRTDRVLIDGDGAFLFIPRFASLVPEGILVVRGSSARLAATALVLGLRGDRFAEWPIDAPTFVTVDTAGAGAWTAWPADAPEPFSGPFDVIVRRDGARPSGAAPPLADGARTVTVRPAPLAGTRPSTLVRATDEALAGTLAACEETIHRSAGDDVQSDDATATVTTVTVRGARAIDAATVSGWFGETGLFAPCLTDGERAEATNAVGSATRTVPWDRVYRVSLLRYA